ncbi:MAG: DUF2851 family protein [bacterium]|nr:DUF2851 family protein [Candidatus Kapabacteria bacterium]
MSHASSWCGHESELYELWCACAEAGTRMVDRNGGDIIVVSRGRRNQRAGPDFLDAVLIIDGRLSVGAVEMHRHESDWFIHGHHLDPAYLSVVLHVVGAAGNTPLLQLPTVLAQSIVRDVEHSRCRDSRIEVSRSLLVECAWARFIRRATQIVRDDHSMNSGERIRRAFLRRVFDALGYSANRKPMRDIIDALLASGALDARLSFDEAASLVFGTGGCSHRIVRDLGREFMSDARLDRIVRAMPPPLPGLRWNRNTRPANVPERRLWAGARLIVEVVHGKKIERLFDHIAAGSNWSDLVREVTARFGSKSFIGNSRASEIVMNAALPVALASGIIGGSTRLIHGACRAYRTAPAQQSNSTVRRIEARYLGGRALTAGFWQQGAIELHQRYFTPDRSGLAFIADDGGAMVIRRAYCVS